MEVFMSDRKFSDIENFQHSGKGIPLFMAGHKNCLQADYFLGPSPRLIKKLPAAGSQKLRNTALTYVPFAFSTKFHPDWQCGPEL
jgi:hypothetical protein